MVKTLSNSDFDYLSIESLSQVLHPPILYKYVDFDTGFYNILMKRTLKFSLPSEFGDPFDCNENLINLDFTKVNFSKILDDITGLIPSDQVEDVIKHVQSFGGTDLVLAKEKLKYRISCFTRNPLSTLMWSHYGCKHNGLCIGFQFKVINRDFNLYPVIYQDDIYRIDGMAPMDKVFLYWLTVKAKGWKYEDEVRAISLSGKEIISYEPEMIREIIFGCNVPDQKIQLVIPFIADNFKSQSIIFRKLIPARDSFTLTPQVL